MPSFGINNLKEFLTTFNQHAIQLVDDLAHKLNEDEFDVHPFLKLCTMNVLLGIKSNIFKRHISNYILQKLHLVLRKTL